MRVPVSSRLRLSNDLDRGVREPHRTQHSPRELERPHRLAPMSVRSEQRHLGRRQIDPAGRGHSCRVEQPPEDHCAPRREVVSVVVEEELAGL
jgi:hypothetical protein